MCSSEQCLAGHGSPWFPSELPEMLIPFGAPRLRECCGVWAWHQPNSKHSAFFLQVFFFQSLLYSSTYLASKKTLFLPQWAAACAACCTWSSLVYFCGRKISEVLHRLFLNFLKSFPFPVYFVSGRKIFLIFELKDNMSWSLFKEMVALDLFKRDKGTVGASTTL